MRCSFIVLPVLAILTSPARPAEAAAPKSADVLATMERAADWQLAHPYTKAPPTDWTNAAFYTGLLALAEVSSSPRFHDAMMQIAERNQWKLGPLPYHADDQCVGQAYAELYLKHGDAKMIAPMQKHLDNILDHPK